MPLWSSTTADPKLLREIFKWGATCTKNCKEKLKDLIARWPKDAKPAQLINPDTTSYTGTDTKLGTYIARLGTTTANNNYEILVHVHNHDAEGATIDPEKKWGKTLNMGGIPGIGIGARLTRGLTNATVGTAVGTAKVIHGISCIGPMGCLGGRKTRRSRGKRSKRTRRR
jgi:hypothetical protein